MKIPQRLALPTDRPRTATSKRGSSVHAEIDDSLLSRVRCLALACDADIDDALFAVWQMLLARWTGQFEFDVLLLGNSHAATGWLRAELSDACSVADAVVRARIAKAAATARSEPGRVDAQLAFVVAARQPGAGAAEGAGAALIDRTYELALVLQPLETGMDAAIYFRADLFEQQTAARLLHGYVRLLQLAAQDGHAEVAKLPLVSESEASRLLMSVPSAELASSADAQIRALFEAQADRVPDSVALVQGRVQLTYRELNHRANRLARRLRARGAARDSVIGICLERSPDMVIAMLAVLKAGAAYLPLDPTFPRDRIAFMLQDAASTLVLTQSAFVELYPSGVAALCLDVAEPADANVDADLPLCGGADDLAYVIYTSGSTGKPKGVMIPHRAAVNFLTSMRSLLNIAPGDRLLAATTLTFDPSLLEIVAPLVSGATVVLATSEERADPWRLSELLDEFEITIMSAAAAMWRQMIAIGWRGRAGLKSITGGEALTPALAQDLLARCAEVWNQYGPTETTVAATCWLVSHPECGVFIGTPIANTRCVILDRNLQLVPAGAYGELCIGGLGLARGYLNREAQTAASFIPDPFVPGERLYRTGDRARWHPSGQLEFGGRIDQQVKVRGFRIEFGEIESELRACPTVHGCVAVVREDRPGDQRIVAYVVGDAPDVSALREQLAARLPAFMRPSYIVVLDAFPLTANGKLDHAALPAPGEACPERSPGQPSEILDPIQRVLAAEWAEIIGVRHVGLDDNFFDLGGHSLLALTLLARIEARFGRRLKIATFLMAPTVRAQARLLRDGLLASTPESLVPIQVSDSGYPLFFASGWGGPVLTLGALAAAMGREQPLYLLDYLGAPNGIETHMTVESVASALVADLRKLQPTGPYHLVGFSLGATIVYEMAQQLRANGHAVPVLVLLDQRPPGHPLHPSYPVRALLHLERGMRSGPVQMWPYLLDHALGLRRYIVEPKPRFYEGVTDDDATRIAAELNRSAQALHRASKRYRIQRYAGRLMVITAQDLSDFGIGAYDGAPTAGWEDWAEHAQFVGSLPCTHRHMLDVEHAALLANLLTRCLALGAEPEPLAAPPGTP